MAMKFFKKLRDKFSSKAGRGNECVSVETHFTQDVAELDKTNPEWDHKSRVAGAARILCNGKVDERMVTVLYGSNVTDDAKKLNAQKPPLTKQ